MIIDLHSHLVPSVDDGASSVAEALLALGGLEAERVSSVVTTPHLLVPFLESRAGVVRELDRHRAGFDLLARAAAGAPGPLPELGLGQEIWAPSAASVRTALECPGLGLGGSRYLLVEFGFDLAGDHREVIDAVLDADYRIVIAHPERYRFSPGFDPIATAAAWREAGALLQLNAGSLGGHYLHSSPDSRALAWRLIEHGLADLIATDHHAASRPVSVSEPWNLLVEAGREAQARAMMIDTPARILRDEEIERQAAA
ncbi:MAG TPA: CpsB/CapC family capsule biosynthesis tyrosine phosphatase [Gemmatimonadales bacterium]|nr:CpsB/CapC family capsule biosynthesis tyrosine phosphatase [Gemmatimonadales bacterium]